MQLLDYERKSTFWNDFRIAERFGAEAIKDTYRRARAGWVRDWACGAESSIVFNHKC